MALRPSFPPRLYRHSRVSGNPTVACRQYHHKAVPFGIPAYAGMTVGRAGKDGLYTRLPGYQPPVDYCRGRFLTGPG